MFLAFFYPLLAALIAWVADGQTNVGTLTVLDEVEEIGARLWRACLIVGGIAIAVLIALAAVTYSARAGLWAQKRVETLTGRTGFLSKAVRPVIEWLAFAFAGAVAGAVAFAVSTEASALILFFYLLLPLANAFADWASVSLTRWFLHDAYHHRYGAWALIGYMLVDFIAGLLCLALLLSGLVALLELWTLFATPPLDWRAYWAAAQADRSNGIALWVMCFTTLLPTLVHVAFALAIWLFGSPRALQRAVEELRHWDDTAPEREQTFGAMQIAKDIQAGRRVQWMRCAVLFTGLAALAAWFEVWTLTNGIQLALDALFPAGT